MKYIFKSILLLSFLTIVSCSSDDNDSNNYTSSYSYTKQVGYSAEDILSANYFSNILIEVMYVEGFQPQTETLNNLKAFIQERTYKSNVIIQQKLLEIPTQTDYSMGEVKKIEDENRSEFSSGDQLTISALFLNGKSDRDTDDSVILGTAYRNTSFVIFEETIHSFSDNPFEPSRKVMESTVILHEFCHLLGLVNIGTPLVHEHQDTENGGHCTNEDCLMYYQAENGSRIGQFISGDKVPQLDAYCIEDLQANGGK
ncbi:membrane metalloprotease [Lutibacter sp. B1]|uniref:membrane metalloprotease n=1 Tax=Lutibacter sp. B1 TaxID=2725996 RepID=UPI0014571B85|nr:membrane metalloprotease [Lutibacter sp. B1]NLP57191.1 membrane metalloprotease [Lutibacter sp. B1]